MIVSILIKKNEEAPEGEQYEGYAYTEGFGVKVTGSSNGNVMRKLHAKLKVVSKFARIARTELEIKLGYHKCFSNIPKQIKIEDNEN